MLSILLPGAAFAALLFAAPARACSVCGCDPASSTLGVDRPGAGILRLGLESRYLAKESGAAEDAESERELRTELRAQWSPITAFALQLDLPVYAFKNHLDARGVQDDSGHGLGDVLVGARYEIVRFGGMIPRHTLAVLGSLKLPTGANDRALQTPPGVPPPPPDEHLQLGSGTFDESLGLSYVYGDLPWALFATAQARVNGSNSRGFHYGNALFGTLGVRRNFLDHDRLLLSLEADVRAAGMDRLADGSHDPDSGGNLYYATAGAAYALTDELLLRGIVQVPVVSALNGVQSEHPVAYLQVSYDFAL